MLVLWPQISAQPNIVKHIMNEKLQQLNYSNENTIGLTEKQRSFAEECGVSFSICVLVTLHSPQNTLWTFFTGSLSSVESSSDENDWQRATLQKFLRTSEFSKQTYIYLHCAKATDLRGNLGKYNHNCLHGLAFFKFRWTYPLKQEIKSIFSLFFWK